MVENVSKCKWAWPIWRDGFTQGNPGEIFLYVYDLRFKSYTIGQNVKWAVIAPP